MLAARSPLATYPGSRIVRRSHRLRSQQFLNPYSLEGF